MKPVRLAAVSHWRRGVWVMAICVAAPLLAAPKKTKEPPSARPPTSEPSLKPARPAFPANVEQKPTIAAKDDDLYEGPAPTRPKTPLTPATAGSRAPVANSPGPKFADAWPSEYRKPEGDLLLAQNADARAQAMAEFVRGKNADARGDADLALEAWKHASALDPENSDLAVKVAFELAKRNEPGEAIRVLKDSIAAAPKEPRTQIYLAQIYARHLNKIDLALAAVQKAIDVAPEEYQAWAAAYDLLQQAGEKKKASELMDRALKSPAKNPEFWLRLGNHQLKLAKNNGKPTDEQLRQMEGCFVRASELKPDSASILTQTGDFFLDTEQPKKALPYYEKATKLNQQPTDDATRHLPEKFADLLIEEGRASEALPILEKLANDTQQAMRSDLYNRLGELYEKAGQVDKAVEHFRQTLVLDTNVPTNHYRLAQVQLRAKRYDDAIATLLATRKDFPNEPDVTEFLGQAYYLAKRFDEALATYDAAAAEMKGRNESRLNPRFIESWASAAERAGKFERAVELFKKSMADFPDDPGAFNDLGYLWVDRGMNLDEAGGLIRKALENSPDNPSFLDSLGWYYFKTGKYEDAKRELLNALSKMTADEPTTLEHLGDTYEKLDNLKEAIQSWEKSLKADPGPDEPEKVKAKVDAAKRKLGTT